MTTLEPVEVIQADRDAAANIWRDFIAKPGECIVERQMRSGSMDWDGSLVQTLARHRIATAQALEARVAELEEALAFIGKWLERGRFDKAVTPLEALKTIQHFPDMVWNSQRWDVDHKPYAEEYYKVFPKTRAALKGSSHDQSNDDPQPI